MLTFQDFEKVRDDERQKKDFLLQAIRDHQTTAAYKTAMSADLYDHQQNETINRYVQTLFDLTGMELTDYTASNAKIASNFFHRLNTQRNTYSLGNGVTFASASEEVQEDGTAKTVDTVKEAQGSYFDADLKKIGYKALIHGVAFGYQDPGKNKRLHCFPVTEFCPLWDENDGRLRAGIRFWQIDKDKPLNITLYEEEGVTQYRKPQAADLELLKDREVYRTFTDQAPIEDEPRIVGEQNYGTLPVIPFWGSALHQSTLVGMQQGIDSFDLIRSGFANDLTDVSQIYWIVENCGGMSDADLARFRDRLRVTHIASANTEDGGKIQPYSQEIPYQARKEFLDEIRAGIYEDFGGLDVHTVSADSTNDHLEAAYQPLDEEADDYEFQIIEFVQQLLRLQGIDDTPIFKRNKVSNQKEQVEMVILEAPYLDDETILSKFPNITPDEIRNILARKDAQDAEKFETGVPEETEEVIV